MQKIINNYTIKNLKINFNKIMSKKNTAAKVYAIIALFAIIWSVVWTWILVIYESYINPSSEIQDNNSQELSNQALQDILQLYTWSLVWSWKLDENTWSININQTWSSLSWKTN